MRAPLALGLLLLLPALGCVEDTVEVEVTTRVASDGSCLRRIEYRLERPEAPEASPRPPVADDVLRLLHRFPSGESWTLKDEATPAVHTVVVEGRLASPNEASGDYTRSAVAGGPAARNHVSFAIRTDDDTSTYDYAEVFADPVSPAAAARSMAQAMVKHEDDLAAAVVSAIDDPRLRKKEVKALLHERLVDPFTRRVAELTSATFFGPHERERLDQLLSKDLDAWSRDFTAGLLALLPGADEAVVSKALDQSFDRWGDGVQRDMDAAGLPLLVGEHRVHFKATLQLPAPIVRANTCAQGDTASWEFEQEDLYGRGFEMWARAVSH